MPTWQKKLQLSALVLLIALVLAIPAPAQGNDCLGMPTIFKLGDPLGRTICFFNQTFSGGSSLLYDGWWVENGKFHEAELLIKGYGECQATLFLKKEMDYTYGYDVSIYNLSPSDMTPNMLVAWGLTEVEVSPNIHDPSLDLVSDSSKFYILQGVDYFGDCWPTPAGQGP